MLNFEIRHRAADATHVNFQLTTDGLGLWSNVVKTVHCTKLSVYVYDTDVEDDRAYGELSVYFDNSWDIKVDGLIYTDKNFLKELSVALQGIGFSTKAIAEVYYSEQGMQGDDYVSFDVAENFLTEYGNMLNICTAKKLKL